MYLFYVDNFKVSFSLEVQVRNETLHSDLAIVFFMLRLAWESM